MMPLRKRSSFAAGFATLALLALPSLASANPGSGPELVQRTGRLVIVHADRPDGTASRHWALVTGDRHVPVEFPGSVSAQPGAQMRLQGAMVGESLAVADSLTSVAQLAASPLDGQETAAAPAAYNTAIILFGFSGTGTTSASLTISNPEANALAFGSGAGSLNAYYGEAAYGQVSYYGIVRGPYDIPGPATSCNPSDLDTWANQARNAASIGAVEYQRYVYVFPHLSACGWSGIADIGGSRVWVNGEFSLRVVAHELGHSLGLFHAGAVACTSAGAPAPIGDSCSSNAYGDPFDVMGGGTAGPVRQMSMAHKLALKVLPTSAVKVVGAPGVYRIAPMETLTGGVELLRLPKPGGGNYYVEYRQPIGYFDSQAPALSGVLVRTDASHTDGNSPDTLLLDMHPLTGANWTDAAMDLGQVFSDPATGITIRVASQDATGATLEISAPRDSVPPSATTGLTATASGTSVALHWVAATDDFQVDSYVVTRDGTAVGTPAGTDFTDTGLVPGTKVAYTVAAVDAGGNMGPAASAAVAIPDTTPPAAPVKMTAKLMKDGKVQLSWTAAVDNGRIATYRVRRNGIAIAAGNALKFSDLAPKPGSGSTVTYSVFARDLAGNAGPVTKARPLRSALLRKLQATGMKVERVTAGARVLLRVSGKVSDSKARCRLRVGAGTWHSCKAEASGAFSVNLPPKGRTPVKLSLRDARGRVKLLTLRVG
jgi:hypothetical protein